MEQQEAFTLPERPPQYFQHDPNTLQLPSIPNTILPSIHHERTLPPISSLTQESDHHFRPIESKEQPPANQLRTEEPSYFWPSANPLTAYYQPSGSHVSPLAKPSTSADSPTAMDLDIDRRRGSVLSMDDPDVRMAAEALGDLRADFIASPPQQHNNLPDSNANPFNSPTRTQPEPLLSLLTTSHPLLGTAIGGSLSAYSASKNYSPRFKSSAEYVERRFSPVVNTVGSVGRVTGVEGGVRWFLGGRRPSHHKPTDLESSNSGSNKRRKVSDHEDMDIDRNVPQDPFPVYRQEFSMQQRERRTSQVSIVESLPAYDDVRSPSYEAQALVPTQQRDDPISPGGSTWQSRLILSTSGLSIAMSEESLRSLKYCLSWLRWANEHIGKVIDTLRSVLEQYSDPEENKNRNENASITNTEGDVNMEMAVTLREKEEARTKVLNAKIASLKNDVLKTLKEVVDVVSRYAGGALPENARVLVRKHLTSLPQRFKLASTSSSGSASNGNASSDPEKGAEVKEGAHRVMVLAKEGLDMMAQVSGVLDGTIVSAEEWCERLGRKKGEEREREMGGSSAEAERDGREAMVNESEKSGADMLKDGQF